MKPSIALEPHKQAVRAAVERYRTANPRVFGSVMKGTGRDESDLDILVDALPGTTLFDLGGLQSALKELLGIKVDVRTPGDLPPGLREEVLESARPI